MSILNLFKKKPELNPKGREIIKHFLTTNNLEILEKSAIIYLVQSVSSIKVAKQNHKNKHLYTEFFTVILELSGLSLDTYKTHSHVFEQNETLANITIQNLSIEQKVVPVILFTILISYCEHYNDDWSQYSEALMQIYNRIDPQVNLYEYATVELTQFIKSRSK